VLHRMSGAAGIAIKGEGKIRPPLQLAYARAGVGAKAGSAISRCHWGSSLQSDNISGSSLLISGLTYCEVSTRQHWLTLRDVGSSMTSLTLHLQLSRPKCPGQEFSGSSVGSRFVAKTLRPCLERTREQSQRQSKAGLMADSCASPGSPLCKQSSLTSSFWSCTNLFGAQRLEVLSHGRRHITPQSRWSQFELRLLSLFLMLTDPTGAVKTQHHGIQMSC
jgi:hypothetical protein